MEWQRIRKRPEDYVGANLQDYEEYAKQFAWSQARALLDGLPNGGINITHEAVDRHVLSGRGNKLALRWIGRDDQVRDFNYAALCAQTNRFANILAERGVAKGDRVFVAIEDFSGSDRSIDLKNCHPSDRFQIVDGPNDALRILILGQTLSVDIDHAKFRNAEYALRDIAISQRHAELRLRLTYQTHRFVAVGLIRLEYRNAQPLAQIHHIRGRRTFIPAAHANAV